MTPQRLAVGVVAGGIGEDGAVRVRWLGDGPQTLLTAETVFVARDDADPLPRRHVVRAAAPHGLDEVRMTLAGLRARADAEAYAGHLVLVDRAALPALGPGELYWHDLVGCRVESTEGEVLGEVTTLWETGAHDLLVVAPSASVEGVDPVLIPTAREIVIDVDVDQRRIVVDLPPGLLER